MKHNLIQVASEFRPVAFLPSAELEIKADTIQVHLDNPFNRSRRSSHESLTDVEEEYCITKNGFQFHIGKLECIGFRRDAPDEPVFRNQRGHTRISWYSKRRLRIKL